MWRSVWQVGLWETQRWSPPGRPGHSQCHLRLQSLVILLLSVWLWLSLVRYLYELPCSWNYIIWQCRIDFWSEVINPRTWLGKNQCKGKLSQNNRQDIYWQFHLEAEENGVSLIHGNSSSFYVLFEEIFRQIYRFWLAFNINNDKLEDAGKKMRQIIRNVTEVTKDKKGKDDTSPCSKVKNMADIMVRRLEHRITQLKT